MPGLTTIEWTEASWNPVTGCTKVSEGCRTAMLNALRNASAGSGSGLTETASMSLSIPTFWLFLSDGGSPDMCSSTR